MASGRRRIWDRCGARCAFLLATCSAFNHHSLSLAPPFDRYPDPFTESCLASIVRPQERLFTPNLSRPPLIYYLSAQSEFITLNDGHKVPSLAFGTGTALYGKDAESAVVQAIEAGFIHLDAAVRLPIVVRYIGFPAFSDG